MSFADSESGRLVHIGPHKTGSTAIQVALNRSRKLLGEHGIGYPSPRRPHRAARELLSGSRHGRMGDDDLAGWLQLLKRIDNSPRPRFAYSDEFLGRLEEPGITRLVDDLGRDRVHVVAVARRYDTYLPSQWQERIKAGVPRSYDEWLRVVLDPEGTHPERRDVWLGHDTAAMVHRWLQFVPPEQFTLVIANESDRSWIFSVFEDLLGLPARSLAEAAVEERSNASLRLPATELLQHANTGLTRRGHDGDAVRERLRDAVDVLLERARDVPGDRNPGFPEWSVEPIRQLSERRIAQIGELPVRVVGDPQWLRMGPLPVMEPSVQTMPVEVAAEVLARATCQHAGIPVAVPAEGDA